MALQKGDFIEIEFTGRLKENNQIFDSNIKADLEEAKLEVNKKLEPFVYSLGNQMFLEKIDETLIGKEEGFQGEISLTSKEAFGLRDSSKIKIVPFRLFKENKLNPIPGATLNFDGQMGKIISANGGRILVDFNHPLAGKDLIYKIKILKKITDKESQVKALNKFLFNQDFEFQIQENNLILDLPKQLEPIIPMFQEKYKELLGLELKAKENK
jgi:FKBP-type peptidyl-prolyl cis-trans isomerase 2